MSFRQKINTLAQKLYKVPKRYYFIFGVVLVMGCYLLVFREQTLAYSYGGDTCGKRLVILPGVFKQSGDSAYDVVTQGGWRVAGQQITATSICVVPVEAPDENSSEAVAFAPWGGWFARFSYTVTTASHPSINMAVLDEPVPASRALLLPLSEPDTTFSYRLEANKQQVDCTPDNEQLQCDVPSLKLKQGSKYEVTLEKYFKGQEVEEVASADLKTLSPLSVVKTSIKNKATAYNKPTSVVLTTDKVIKNADIAVWRTDGKKPEKLEASSKVDGKKATVTFAEDLPREATIALKMGTLEATDGSTPLDKQLLVFKTSGGPEVTSVNVGSSGVMIGTRIVVTFDQKLAGNQDLSSLITASGGVKYQGKSANQLFFSTDAAARCATISIGLKSGIESPAGISGKSAWQYSGRMSCYTISTIGYSSQGRPITAYFFGSSGPSVLYTGAIHGNEFSTKYLMDRWIQELDAHPAKIPKGKRIIVVPMINPDGFAAGTRLNAKRVDLNRNFATSDWKKDIEDLNGNPFPGGGGKKPMSEPETNVIAGFVAQQRPELVISYHSTAWLVISNQVGQANARASQYASLSGYQLSSGGGGEFNYQITGTADDYYAEKLSVASIVVELGSQHYHQFELNQAAMWAMMK